MKVVALHDRQGKIAALVVGPAGDKAPPGVVGLPGHLGTEVEADISHNLEDEATHAAALELLKSSRVEVGKAKLVRRDKAD
jgi:dienelactone hydrolase